MMQKSVPCWKSLPAQEISQSEIGMYYVLLIGAHKLYVGVLVSAGTELAFFLVAGTVLCFGFSVRVMLVALRCFGCCWVALLLGQGLFSFPCSASKQVCRKLGGSIARAADLN